jgi:hypothetical protein
MSKYHLYSSFLRGSGWLGDIVKSRMGYRKIVPSLDDAEVVPSSSDSKN